MNDELPELDTRERRYGSGHLPLGSPKEHTWNPIAKQHTCCGASRGGFHKTTCPIVISKVEIRNRKRSLVMIDEATGNEIRRSQHANRKNNDLVAAMYAMYCTKRSDDKYNSIADVARVYGRSRQAVYDTFKCRGYALRSKQLEGLTIVDGFRFTINKGGYLRGTVNGRRMLMHWYIWEKAHGPVPPGFCVHHKNDLPADNELSNLELVPRNEMGPRFGKGRNQFSPGYIPKIKKMSRVDRQWATADSI